LFVAIGVVMVIIAAAVWTSLHFLCCHINIIYHTFDLMQDMADLATTSRVSVLFQCLTVLVVVIFSPISSSLEQNGGLQQIASQSIIKTNSIFIGLGVLSFAFVCQHSAFIVAGSLERPTRKRWGQVTGMALSLCVILEGSIGVTGYLAFLETTEGNVLNNFLEFEGSIRQAANVARGLLCTTMFFVYPMDSFVCRHVLVVLLFRGRRAHEGDDAAVLSRRDRRVAMTLVIYLSSLIPALMVDNVGSVLAITGTIAGSSLSYIGPGLVYLAVYGDEFLQKVDEVWGDAIEIENGEEQDAETANLVPKVNESNDANEAPSSIQSAWKQMTWHLFLMPLWCSIATLGKRKLKLFREKEALKSPHLNRLGKIKNAPMVRANSYTKVDNLIPPSNPHQNYGAAITLSKNKSDSMQSTRSSLGGDEDADIDTPPTWYDFGIAIFFVIFGMVALTAGLLSILMT
jgi:sodium-coupled neutral amino acid transporter 11